VGNLRIIRIVTETNEQIPVVNYTPKFVILHHSSSTTKLKHRLFHSELQLKTKEHIGVGFDVLTTVLMTSWVFCGTTSCSPVRDLSASIKSQVVSFWFLAWLSLRLCRLRLYVSPKRPFAFTGVHGGYFPDDRNLQDY
jgi:hypothetical protein